MKAGPELGLLATFPTVPAGTVLPFRLRLCEMSHISFDRCACGNAKDIARRAGNSPLSGRTTKFGLDSADIVRVICERAGQAAGFGFRVRPHMFRHAAGFALAEEGTDTRLIQDFLGHKDIKSTVIYTETSQRRLAGVRVR